MKKKSVKVTGEVHVNVWPILNDAMETAIGFGLSRSYKHTDTPTQEYMQECIHREVMNHLAELFVFDHGESE